MKASIKFLSSSSITTTFLFNLISCLLVLTSRKKAKQKDVRAGSNEKHIVL